MSYQTQIKEKASRIFFLVLAMCLILGAVNVFGGEGSGPSTGPTVSPDRDSEVPDEPGSGDAFCSPDEVVVKLISTNPLAVIEDINAEFQTNTIRFFPRLGIFLLRITDGSSPFTKSRLMRESEIVLSARPNYLVDPMQPVQGSFPLPDVDQDGEFLEQPAADMLNLTETHMISTGSGVRVALIDGGINYSHPAFNNMAFSGYDYVDNDNDAFDEPGGENSGHGTFVAGVIHLIAPDAEIFGYRVCNPSGESNGYVVAEAMMQAIDDGCSVINLSLITTAPHNAIATAIEYAKASNVLVIAAAGNGNSYGELYPANDPYVISVGAVNNEGQLADFTNHSDYVDVYAPGVNIYSPYVGDSYAWWNGTSFSAPFVAGQAALILGKDDQGYVDREWMLNTIIETAQDIGTRDANGTITGYGLIDPLSSLNIDPPAFGILDNYRQYPDVLHVLASEPSPYSLVFWLLTVHDSNNHDYTIESVDAPEFVKSWMVWNPTTPTFVYFEIDPTGLPLGIYQDTVQISIEGMYNSPITKIFTLRVSSEDSPIEAYGVFDWASHMAEGSTRIRKYLFKPMARQWNGLKAKYDDLALPYQVNVESSPEYITDVELWIDYDGPDAEEYTDSLTTDYWLYTVSAGDLTPGMYYDTIFISVEGAVNNPYMLETHLEIRPDEWINMTVIEPIPDNLILNGYDPWTRVQQITFLDIEEHSTEVDTFNVELQVDGVPRAFNLDIADGFPEPNEGFIDINPSSGTTTDTLRFIVDWSKHGAPFIHPDFWYFHAWDVEVENVADINYIFQMNFKIIEDQPLAVSSTNESLVIDVGNYPNPFNPVTEFRFNLPRDAQTTLIIYNLLGQEVKQLIKEVLPAGQHSLIWNGTNSHGLQVASGIYLYRLTADDQAITKKMVLLK